MDNIKVKTFYHPQISNTFIDLRNKYLSNEVGFVIGPYTHKEGANYLENFEEMLLFDFPANILICIADIFIDSSVFDYLNPLYFTMENYKYIKFYNKETLKLDNDFQCKCILFKDKLKFPEPCLIYYPPGYVINYNTMAVLRTTLKGKQLVDYIDRMWTHEIIFQVLPSLSLFI